MELAKLALAAENFQVRVDLGGATHLLWSVRHGETSGSWRFRLASRARTALASPSCSFCGQ